MRLLLGSGGFNTPERQTVWKNETNAFLGAVTEVLFLPYAQADHDLGLKQMTARGFCTGREFAGIHQFSNPQRAVLEAKAIYIGGGNSFRLLNALYEKQLLELIRQQIRNGVPYIGVSAGANMACPSLKTTNDMPIVSPPSFDALGLIPFQINPHYFYGPIHMQMASGMVPYAGETRDDRLREFHEENPLTVLGLWEGGILRIEGSSAKLKGPAAAKLFQRGKAAVDLEAGSDLSELLV